MAVLPVRKGISSAAVTSIPDKWNKQWFRYFIDAFLTGADIRNVTTPSGSGIVITGNVSGNTSSGTGAPSVTISQSPIANNTVLGNISGSTAIPTALSQTQLTSLINLFTSTISGAVPLSGGGTVNFLRADGTWSVPAGSAAIPNNTVLGNISGGTASAVALTQTQLTALINVFSATLSGAVPASGGGTTNFLRADGTFAVPTQPVGANPSAAIGLSAVNGVATTFMRSDAAPQLGQGIVPTWGGLHTFSAGLTVSGSVFQSRGILDNGLSNAITISNTQAVTLTAPTSGSFTVNGVNTAVAAIISSGVSGSTGGADLKVVRAGSTVNQAGQGPNLFLNDSVGVTGYYLQDSGGQFEIWSSVGGGPTLTQLFKILTSGGVVINTPASGSALTVNMLSANAAAAFQGPSVSNAGWNVEFFDTTASAARGFIGIGTNTIGGSLSTDFGIASGVGGSTVIGTANGGNIAVRFGPNGNVTIATPSSGDTLTVAPSVTTGALMASSAALTNNAGASAGTLTNAPAAGNPTKWIKINDNGTIRSIPAW